METIVCWKFFSRVGTWKDQSSQGISGNWPTIFNINFHQLVCIIIIILKLFHVSLLRPHSSNLHNIILSPLWPLNYFGNFSQDLAPRGTSLPKGFPETGPPWFESLSSLVSLVCFMFLYFSIHSSNSHNIIPSPSWSL